MSNPESRPTAMWERRIRQRAQEIYEARLRNGISATDWDDWLEAERIDLAEIQRSKLCEVHHETHKLKPEQKDAVETKLQTHSGLHVEDVEKIAQGRSISSETSK
jgi:hypothetical protein